jgi:hypothetical protein
MYFDIGYHINDERQGPGNIISLLYNTPRRHTQRGAIRSSFIAKMVLIGNFVGSVRIPGCRVRVKNITEYLEKLVFFKCYFMVEAVG